VKPYPRRALDHDAVLARPLTVTGLVKGVGRNFVCMNYWRFLRLLLIFGFLPTDEGAMMSWRTFNPRFWRNRGDRFRLWLVKWYRKSREALRR
jgi:hypothetical protein